MEINRLRKINQILICSFLVIAGLYYGSSLLIPLTFAVFFATLVLPMVNYMEGNWGAGRLTSSFVGTLMIFVGLGLLFFFLVNELARFLTDIVQNREEIISYFQTLQETLASNTRFSLELQQDILKDSIVNIINATQSFVSGLLTNFLGLVMGLLLVLVFVFLMLVNRNKIVDFLMMYTPEKQQKEVDEIIGASSKVAYKYLWGRMKVMFGLSLMYLVAFLAYGLPHIGLLIIFGALITIIPFIGPFLSGLLPILFMIGFGGSYAEILSFTILISVIQLIESYVLEPLLIGSELQQSPLFVIIAVLFGGVIWGPAGFILFVPIFGIMKIIFDHIPGLKPVGFLIGYERPGSGEGVMEKMKKKFRK